MWRILPVPVYVRKVPGERLAADSLRYNPHHSLPVQAPLPLYDSVG